MEEQMCNSESRIIRGMLRLTKLNDGPHLGIWSKITLKTGEQVSIGPPKLSDTVELTKFLSIVATENESIPISESEITAQGVRTMILKMQRSDDVSLVVARANDTIIAFAEMQRAKYWMHDKTAKLGIVVDRKYRRKGIGRALIEFLEEQPRNAQIRQISLLVPANNIDAIRFYRRLGFTNQGA